LGEVRNTDIAEIFWMEELDFEEATYIFKLLDSDKTAEILLELEDDLRENINEVSFRQRNHLGRTR
jgi:magnesium transporter